MTDQEEQDRRSGLHRILEALEAVSASVDATRAEVAALHERVDALVAASDLPVTGEHVQAVVNTALSILPPPQVDERKITEAVRASVRALPPATADVGPVLDALRKHAFRVDGAEVVDGVQRELSRFVDRVSPPAVDIEELAALVSRRLSRQMASLTPAESERPSGQEPSARTRQHGLGPEVEDLVRRTVAASHRALLTSIGSRLADLERTVLDGRPRLAPEPERAPDHDRAE